MSLTLPLAQRLENIAPFHVMELSKRAAELEKQGRHLIHLGIGEPDFTAPPLIVEAATKALAEGRLQYTSATGIPALRHAIARHYQETFGLKIVPERIIVTAGASAALLLACAALVEKGAEVLMPDPSYPCNRHFVAAFDGVPRLIPCGPEDRFQLTGDMVARHWNSATRGVLLASPSNPTGTTIAPEALRAIVTEVRRHGGFTVVDEIYQGLTYDAAPTSALAEGDDVIVINSFSKYFNMTGWRLGWLVAPEALVPEFEKLSQNFFICASSVAQHAGVACFAPESLAIYAARKEEFRRRRDYLVPQLRAMGLDIPITPDGAFYVYADCSGMTDDANALSMELMHQAGVVVVPGLDFGSHAARRYLRISYATSMDNLQEAVRRMHAFFAKRLATGRQASA